MAHKVRARSAEKRAHGRSLSDFGNLRPAEKLLLAATRIGDIAVVAETRPETLTYENAVRAGFLRFLLLGGDAQAPVHEHGVQLQGAWVEGVLDLANALTIGAVHCLQCNFDEPLMLWHSRVRGNLSLFGSAICGLKGDYLVCEGGIFLNEGFRCTGSIMITSAKIAGDFICDGAKLNGAGNDALIASGVEISGDVCFREGFEAVGLLEFFCAKIEGHVVFLDAKLNGVGNYSLSAQGVKIGGGVYFAENAEFIRSVNLNEARISHGLHCYGSKFDGRGKAGLSASCAVIGGSVSVDDGAKVVGSLDLQQIKIAGALRLGPATLDGQASDAILASGSEVKGGVHLLAGLETFGSVFFSNANVENQFSCHGSTLNGNGGHALSLDSAMIRGGFFLGSGFHSKGSIRLIGAEIDVGFHCGEVVIEGEGEFSVIAQGTKILGKIEFLSGFRSIGEISFLDAKIEGGLSFVGAYLDGKGGNSISLTQAQVGGALTFREGSKAIGTFRIDSGRIGGSLDFGRGQIDGNGGEAVLAFGIDVEGSIFARDEFEAKGRVVLIGAQIGSDFRLMKSIFHGNGEHAIMGANSLIKGSAFFCDGFLATGTIDLNGAKIHGDLHCLVAKFYSRSNLALTASAAEVRNVFLACGFEAKGAVYLIGTKIAGDLSCEEALFDAEAEVTLAATNMRVGNRLIFRNLKAPLPRVWLSAVTVGVLCDDLVAWGEGLVLNNFTYDRFAGGTPTSARERIAWLDKQCPTESGLAGYGTEFRPQPWRHLQRVLREMGHVEDARQVAVAMEHRMRKAGVIGQTQDSPRIWLIWANRPRRWLYRKVACFFHWWFWALTGYGYRPMRLMGWMLAVWLGCAAFYWTMALPPRDVFAPSNPLVFQSSFYRPCLPCEDIREATPAAQSAAFAACSTAQAQMREELLRDGKLFHPGNWYLCPRVREEYTGFSPLAYSLDVILPLVDLQQQKDWGAMIPTPEPGVVSELGTVTGKHVTRFVVWFETLFGWLASLLLVAIVSGLTKRRED